MIDVGYTVTTSFKDFKEEEPKKAVKKCKRCGKGRGPFLLEWCSHCAAALWSDESKSKSAKQDGCYEFLWRKD